MLDLGVKCKHRHNIKDHPSCFWKMVSEGKEKPDWYKNLKIGYLDIESSGLKPNFAIMYTWALKSREGGKDHGKVYHDMMRPEDFNYQIQDKRVVSTLINKMVEYDMVVTYYGTGFDIPFLRARAMYWGIPFPGYGMILHHDLYYTVRSKIHLSSNSLKTTTEFLGIAGKTDIETKYWRNAIFGHAESLREILRHNIADVVILEKLHDKLENYIKGSKTSI